MEGLRSPKDAADWMRENYDVEAYDLLFRDQRYAVCGVDRGIGEANEFRGTWYNDGLPVYHDMLPRLQQVGVSNRLMSDAYYAVSSLVTAPPLPVSPDTDIITSALRGGYFQSRWQGVGTDGGEWQDAVTRATIDNFLLGVGCVQVGVRRDRNSGMRYVDINYHQPVNVVFDRFAVPYQKGAAVAFIRFMSVAEVEMYYRSLLDEQNRNPKNQERKRHFETSPAATEEELNDTKGSVKNIDRAEIEKASQRVSPAPGSISGYPVVRVVEYFDIGICGSEPTHIIWLGSINSGPIYHALNAYNRLPLASMTHFNPPGVSRPYGRARMGKGTQAIRQSIERDIVNRCENGGAIDMIDERYISIRDLEKARKSGKPAVAIKGELSRESLINFRLPELGIPQSHLEALRYYDALDNAESNTTDLDRGSAISGVDSATEAQLLADRSAERRSLLKHEQIRFYQRLAETVFEIGKNFDRHPVNVDVEAMDQRMTLVLNDHADEGTSLEYLMSEPSRVMIDETSLTAAEESRRQMERLMILSKAADLGVVGPGPDQISVRTMSKAVLTHLGYENLDEHINPTAEEMMAQQQGMMGPQMATNGPADPAILGQ